MFEYEARLGTAPEGVRLASHHRFMSATIWHNLSLQARAETFDELEAEFLAILAPTAAIQIGVNSWRATPDATDATDLLRLEVSGPVYQPPKRSADRSSASISFERRPIPTAESVGAATRSLIMAANELAVAVRTMIGDSEPGVLHQPVHQLEQCLAAWPDEVAQAMARTQAVRDACDQIQRLAGGPLMKVGVYDILRVRLERIVAGLAKTFDLEPKERYWTFVKVPAEPTTESVEEQSLSDGVRARVAAESVLGAHLAKVDELLTGVFPRAVRGDPTACTAAIRLLEHQAVLMGLYPHGES